MYTKKTKRGSSEKSTLSNQLITARNLRLKIKQLVEKENFFELEPVEVLKVYPTGSSDDKGYIDYGRIVGRYVVSEQGLPFEECKDFFPLDTNVLQYPLEGEVVVGFEFNKERYYFTFKTFSSCFLTFCSFSSATLEVSTVDLLLPHHCRPFCSMKKDLHPARSEPI